MLASFLLALREGLEAALILGIVLGVLRQAHQDKLVPPVWRGAAAAFVLSLIIAILLDLIGAEFEGNTEVIFEGTTMLLAACLLTWMIFWMRRQLKYMRPSIEAEVMRAAQQGSQRAMFLVAFIAILREGVELSIYLLASRLQSNVLDTFLGATIGIGAAALLGMLTFRTTRRLSLKNVFRVTNVLLMLFAAGLVGAGVHEFVEIGWIPPIIAPVWNLNGLLPEQSIMGQLIKILFGYNGSPALSEVIAYLTYLLLLMTSWFVFQTRMPVRREV